jgi:hypothetical protein
MGTRAGEHPPRFVNVLGAARRTAHTRHASTLRATPSRCVDRYLTILKLLWQSERGSNSSAEADAGHAGHGDALRRRPSNRADKRTSDDQDLALAPIAEGLLHPYKLPTLIGPPLRWVFGSDSTLAHCR